MVTSLVTMNYQSISIYCIEIYFAKNVEWIKKKVITHPSLKK